MKRVYYHADHDEDVVNSRHQDRKLPKNYKWLHNNISYMIYSKILFGIFSIVGLVYMRVILRVKVVGKEKLKSAGRGEAGQREDAEQENMERSSGRRRSGYFLIGNHTQPQGDVFGPAMMAWPQRPYYVVAPANLGIPVIGRLLPGLGAIVIPDDVHEMTKFRAAVKHWAATQPIVIYPEAHVWPYYTKLRPMKLGAFQLAVEERKEVFTMTTTYQKRGNRLGRCEQKRNDGLGRREQKRKRRSKRPCIVIYIDGPFRADPNLSKKQAARQLREKVQQQMEKRCRKSDVEFVKYIEKPSAE